MRVTIVAKLVKNFLLGTWIVLSSIEFFFIQAVLFVAKFDRNLTKLISHTIRWSERFSFKQILW